MSDALYRAVELGDIDTVNTELSRTMNYAVKKAQPPIIRLLSGKGFPFNHSVPTGLPFKNSMLIAITRKDVDVIQCVYDLGCRFITEPGVYSSMTAAIMTHDLEVVRKIHELGCPFETNSGQYNSMNVAITIESTEMIEGIRNLGCIVIDENVELANGSDDHGITQLVSNIFRRQSLPPSPPSQSSLFDDASQSEAQQSDTPGPAQRENEMIEEMTSAIYHKDIAEIERLHSLGYPFDTSEIHNSINYAIFNKDIVVIQKVFDLGCPFVTSDRQEHSMNGAILTKNVDVIQKVFDLGCSFLTGGTSWNSMNYAIETEDLAVVQKVFDLGCPFLTLEGYIFYSSMNAAIATENVDIIQKVIDLGCPLSENAMDRAIRGSTPAVVEFLTQLVERAERSATMSSAIRNKQIAEIGRLHSLGYIFNTTQGIESSMNLAITTQDAAVIQKVFDLGCSFNTESMLEAIATKNMAIIQKVVDLGCIFNITENMPDYPMNVAIDTTDVDIIQKVFDLGCQFNITEDGDHSMNRAVLTKNVVIIQKVFDLGCPFKTTETGYLSMNIAINTKDLDVIQKVFDLGCPFSTTEEGPHSMNAAIVTNDAHIVQKVFDLGCPFKTTTGSRMCSMDLAIDKAKADIIQKVFDLGCPLSPDAMDEAISTGMPAIIGLVTQLVEQRHRASRGTRVSQNPYMTNCLSARCRNADSDCPDGQATDAVTMECIPPQFCWTDPVSQQCFDIRSLYRYHKAKPLETRTPDRNAEMPLDLLNRMQDEDLEIDE